MTENFQIGKRARNLIVGILAELQGKVFDKFQQLDTPVKGDEKGSGLGLALVREIIEHHKGKVGVESEQGKGSEFYFMLKIMV